MKINKIVKESINEWLNEQSSNLTLYHGSNGKEIFSSFYDNQFFTVNDYIASNYAYNFGGFMYEVSVSHLNPFELQGYNQFKNPNEYNFMIDLLDKLYGETTSSHYERMYFTPSPSYTFGERGYEPIIKWAKENGYDSLKFVDESFDTFVHDITYIIFDGSKAKILSIFDVEDAVNSNFRIDFKKIK